MIRRAITMLDSLSQSFSHGSLHLKNRFVMAPMTRYFSPGGIPSEEMAGYYRRRAEGDIGLIISEGVGIDRPGSRAVTTVPNFHGESALGKWRAILDEVHDAGARMAPQLWHVGGASDYNFPDADHAPLESPSGFIAPDVKGGKAMTEEAVADTIAAFARAASEAKRLGFDALEVHGAHGYLVDQFFWAGTNRRTDRYGGASIGERARFAADVFRAMRNAVGEDFTLILRISQWKVGHYDVQIADTPRQLEEWVAPLAEAGVDIFDCSQRRFWETEFEDSDLNLAGWVKKLTGCPTITVGSVGLDRDLFADTEKGGQSGVNLASLTELERRFDRGDFDLVAVGRALLADPYWLCKVREGRLDQLAPYSAAAMATLS